MKFIMTYNWKPNTESRGEAIARFKKTGGLPPNPAAKLLGRWTRADFSGGFELIETNDPEALTEFALMWSDLMELSVVPVIEDKELSAVLERFNK